MSYEMRGADSAPSKVSDDCVRVRGSGFRFSRECMRGGRLRKTVRGVMTFAPFMATASAVALGALLATGVPAGAGNCGTGTGSGERTCSGAANSTDDRTVAANVGANQSVTLRDNGGDFGLRVTTDSNPLSLDSGNSARGIHAATSDTSRKVEIMLTSTGDHAISARDEAIFVNNSGDGPVEISVAQDVHSDEEHAVRVVQTKAAATNGAVNIDIKGRIGSAPTRNQAGMGENNGVGRDGVHVDSLAPGDVAIKTAMVHAKGKGIFATQRNTGSAALSVTLAGNIDAGNDNTSPAEDINAHGIDISNSGTGATTIAIDDGVSSAGDVDSSTGKGIVAKTAAGSAAASVSVRAVVAKKEAIEFDHLGNSSLTVEATGSVFSSTEEGILIRTSGATNPGGGDGGAGTLASTVTDIIVTAGRRGSTADVVQAEKEAIFVQHNGTGSTTITSFSRVRSIGHTDADDAVMNRTSEEGIAVFSASTTTGKVTVTTHNGVLSEDKEGIYVHNDGSGDIEVTSGGTITSHAEGIDIIQDGAGAVTITADDISATAEDGIEVQTAADTMGKVEVTANGSIASTGNDTVGGKDGIYVHNDGSGDVEVTTSGTITAHVHGINIDQDGAGAVTVTASDISATADNGIEVQTAAETTGNVEVTASGNIASTGNDTVDGKDGIYVHNDGSGDVEVTASGTIMAGAHGININQDGAGAVTVTADGAINSTGEGIAINTHTSTTGDVIVTANSDITSTESEGIGISSQSDSSNVLVVLNGTVTGVGNSTNAVQVAAAGDARIVFNDGSGIDGELDLENVIGTATIELAGTADDNSFSLTDISGNGSNDPEMLQVDAIEKSGAGTWTLTASDGAAKFIPEVNISEGRLVWSGASSQFQSLSMTIADGAVFEVAEYTLLSGATIALGGDIDLGGADAALELAGVLTNNGGSVAIAVDFSAYREDTRLGTPRFKVDSVAGGESVPVRIRSAGGVPTGGITLSNFIEASEVGELGEETFVAAPDSPISFELQNVGSIWDVVIGSRGGGTVHDALPAVLGHLARPQTLHHRLHDRKHRRGTNAWMKVSGDVAEVETSAASFDTQNAEVQLGVRAPMRHLVSERWTRNVAFDANIALSKADTEALTVAGTRDIASVGFGAALGATWKRGGTYIDNQLRYTRFDNTLKDNLGVTLATPNADVFVASAEIGYDALGIGGGLSLADVLGEEFVRDVGGALEAVGLGFGSSGAVDIPEIRFVPSAQVSWSTVDFNKYTSTMGTFVQQEDGDVAHARAGLVAETEVDGVKLHASADVSLPLDGEFVTEVAGVSMATEREALAYDVGIGIAYQWEDAYSLRADVSTQQGRDIEGYTGSVGFKYEF